MKELSISEKAKAYDEAINRAKKLYGNGIAEEIFHELKEDDTERIRKNCIHFLELQKQHHAATFEIEECITWLEKQGEQKPQGKSALEAIKEEKVDNANKVEPKFKIGDKIVNRVNMYMGDLSHQDVISEITEDKYILNDGGYIYFKDQDIWELAPDKFDPKTLRPYDKVLVRYDSEKGRWRCTLFSHIIEDEKIPFRFVTSNNAYEYCIPYNDKTKHLVGTTKEAPEYYRYWED